MPCNQELINSTFNSVNNNDHQAITTTDQEVLNSKDNLGNTPLMVACQLGHLDSALKLLQLGASPYKLNNNKYQALEIAAEHNQPQLVEVILEYHFDYERQQYNFKGLHCSSAYLLATVLDYEHIIKMFHNFGYYSCKSETKQFLKLIAAVKAYNGTMVKELISQGAQVEVRSANKIFSALPIAIKQDDPIIINDLLGFNYSPDTITLALLTLKTHQYCFINDLFAKLTSQHDQKKLLKELIKNNKPELLTHILGNELYEGSLNYLLTFAVINNNAHIVEILLKNDANPNSLTDFITDYYPYINTATVIHEAICQKSWLIVELLCEHGADIFADHVNSQNALTRIVIANQQQLLTNIINESDLDEQNTIIFWALVNTPTNNLELFQHLLSLNYDLTSVEDGFSITRKLLHINTLNAQRLQILYEFGFDINYEFKFTNGKRPNLLAESLIRQNSEVFSQAILDGADPLYCLNNLLTNNEHREFFWHELSQIDVNKSVKIKPLAMLCIFIAKARHQISFKSEKYNLRIPNSFLQNIDIAKMPDNAFFGFLLAFAFIGVHFGEDYTKHSNIIHVNIDKSQIKLVANNICSGIKPTTNIVNLELITAELARILENHYLNKIKERRDHIPQDNLLNPIIFRLGDLYYNIMTFIYPKPQLLPMLQYQYCCLNYIGNHVIKIQAPDEADLDLPPAKRPFLDSARGATNLSGQKRNGDDLLDDDRPSNKRQRTNDGINTADNNLDTHLFTAALAIDQMQQQDTDAGMDVVNSYSGLH